MHSALPLYVSLYLLRSRDEDVRRNANRPAWRTALEHERRQATSRHRKRRHR